MFEKGFQLRIACEDKSKAVKLFGMNNVDIVQLKADSDEAIYAKAVQGTQAVVFCNNFTPGGSNNLWPFSKLISFGSSAKNDMVIANRILDMAIRAKAANVGTIQKLVAVSRSLPWLDEESSKRKVTENDNNGGILGDFLSNRVDSTQLNSFRRTHMNFENSIRQAGFEYSIVRAPPLVEVRIIHCTLYYIICHYMLQQIPLYSSIPFKVYW